MAALPAGWEEKFSAQHQRKFYKNTATGESSWVLPTHSSGNPAASSRASRREDPRDSETVALPAGWSESYSQQHQRVYYRNAGTGETSWSRPVIPATDSKTDSRQREQTRNPLHSWTEHYSETHQRSYFRNDTTGETSWARPSTAAPGATRRSNTQAGPASGGIKVCVFGGGTQVGDFICQGITAEAEMFDMQEWRQTQTVGLPRGGCAAASIGPQAYVFGGGRSAAAIEAFECGEPNRGQWRRAGVVHSTRLLTCLQGIHCPAAAELDGLLYLVGGQDSFGALTSVHLYIPKDEQTVHLTSMRVPRAGCSCATMGDLLYVVGGRSGIFSCTAVVYSSVETYDPVDDVWGKIANMSEQRDGCAAVASSGRLYVLGGSDEDRSLSTVEVFDPADGRWSYVASMSTPRRGVAAVELPGGKILACGGWDGTQLLKTCEMYDVELDQWSDLPYDMVSGRMYHGICAIGT